MGGKLGLLGVLTVLGLGGMPLHGQTGSSVIEGVVRDNEGARLAGAQVVVQSVGRVLTTDAEGRFVVRGVRDGVHRVQVSHAGYAPETRVAELPRGGGRVGLEVVLRRTVLSLPGIQVTATPTSSDVRAVTQATTQLGGKALEREMAGTVAQTLRYQPGIAVRSMGPAASAPIVRGLTGDRVLVLQDGQRTADLSGSADDHGVTIDPLSAQRVEVVRGPATLLYGNNALGGVINVISGDLPTHSPTRPEWAASLQSESAYPGGSGALRAHLPLGGSWVVAMRAGARSTSDMRIPLDPTLGSRLQNTQANNLNGSFGLGYSGEGRSAGAAVKAYTFGYGLPTPPGADPVSLVGRRHEAVARLEQSLGSSLFSGLRIDATGQSYLHDEVDGAGAVQQTFVLRTQTLNALVRQNAVGRLAEGAWGVSALLKQYTATGPAALTPAADSRGVGAFGFQELRLTPGGVALQLGGRADRYDIVSKSSPKFGPGRERVFHALSGSAGLRLPLTGWVTAAFNVARSFRAPTVEELFSGAPHAGTGSMELGSPDLLAERGRSAEALLQVRNGRVNGQLAIFRNDIANYVHLVARGDTLIDGVVLPVFAYGQDDARLQGIEGQIEWAVRPDLAIGATGDLLHAEQVDGTPLSYMPPARLGALARWEKGGLSLSSDVHHEFRQDRVGAADERPTEAHTILRVSAGFRWTQGKMLHSVTLRGENLGNELHREATSRIKDFAPGPGRNVALLYRVYF